MIRHDLFGLSRGGRSSSGAANGHRDIFCNTTDLFTYEATSQYGLKNLFENNQVVGLIRPADDGSSLKEISDAEGI